MALLGAREPLAVIPAALAVGFLETGGQSMQRQIGVPSALVVVIEGLTMLFVLAAAARRHMIEFLEAAIRIATPLLFAALGGVLSESAGVFAVGLEGMMLMGAFASATGAWGFGFGAGGRGAQPSRRRGDGARRGAGRRARARRRDGSPASPPIFSRRASRATGCGRLAATDPESPST